MNPQISLTYSLADQHFHRTKSIGILNFSVDFLKHVAQRSEVRQLTVLNNSTLLDRVNVPRAAKQVVSNQGISGRLGRIWWDQVGMYSVAREAGNEWLFLPKGFASFMRKCPTKLSGYLADIVPEFYRQHYPRTFSQFETWYFIFGIKAMLGAASVVFTNSDFSRSEIARLARQRGWPEPRLRTMGIGFDRPSTIREKQNVIVVIASPLPHKRTAMAIELLSHWQESTNYTGQICWVGRLPADHNLPPFPNWQLHSRMEETAFRTLAETAKVLIYTSEYEGFGMPPVEAVLSHTCPVFSSIPATQEVMGKCGCPFVNNSYESFSSALQNALQTSRDTLESWATQLLTRHNWSRVTDVFVSELANLTSAACKNRGS